jgi:methylated-DNA-protein-cysteine methyltransferase-like protein
LFARSNNSNINFCHRVIGRNGRISSELAFRSKEGQKKLLEEEGIIFEKDGKINLNGYAIIPLILNNNKYRIDKQ